MSGTSPVSFLLVVVVVWVAMQQKQSDKARLVAVRENYVIRYTEERDSNIVSSVYVTDANLESHTLYDIVIEAENGCAENKVLTEFEAKTDKDGKAITIPEKVRQSGVLQPGKTVNLKIYEQTESETFEDNAEVIDRVNPTKDAQNSDGLQSSLYSESAWDYIKNGGNKIGYRNVRTKKSAEAEPTAYARTTNRGYRVSFPSGVREAIDAKEDDLIELIGISDANDKEDNKTTNKSDEEEMIEEIHSMMTEMYNAYLKQKDD